MNPIDDQLNRLFRAAQKAPSPDIAPPYGLETRVLAAWREASAAPVAFWDMTVLTRALVLSAIVMAACFLPALNSSSSTSTASSFTEVAQMTDADFASDAYP